MKKLMRSTVVLVVLLVTVALVAPAASAGGFGPPGHTAGAVYTMTNDPAGNAVVVFDRAKDGTLTLAGNVPTGGLGSGGGVDPLASQNSLVLSDNGKWLLAVNAGSDDVTLFRVTKEGLEIADRVASGGTMPVSVTFARNRVFVLNAGGTANISGFLVQHGTLDPVAAWTRDLGPGGFSQVGFDPHSRTLIITDRGDSELLAFPLEGSGAPSLAPVVTPSSGTTPFGFTVEKAGRILVVEVNGGNGAVSSYHADKDGSLDLISASVASGQAAACWIASDGHGNAYTTNPASMSISRYSATKQGEVALIDATAAAGVMTLDAGISKDGKALYALSPNGGGIEGFAIAKDGSLTPLGLTAGGLMPYAQGLAAR